jgi:hypothetical protein
MPDRRHLFMGNSFLTILDLDEGPVWGPLEDLARVVGQAPGLPKFHPAEFMYMAAVHGERRRVTIHLYKHIDTRRYLNLDDGGHAYAYQFRLDDPRSTNFGGRYRRYRNLVSALDAVDLGAFDASPPLLRSYPPEMWPAYAGIHAEDDSETDG